MRREISESELTFFYQKTGEAIWHLQYVEDFLAKLYFIKIIAVKPNGISEKDAKKPMKDLEKKTLGQLIGLVESTSSLSPSGITKLKEFNDIRKWIVHNSNRESGDSLYTDSGRDYFVSKICKFTGMAIELQKLIERELVNYGVDCNVSPEEIHMSAKNTVNKLKGKA